MQVTLLLPTFTALVLEHVIPTAVPEFTGNCVDVSIVLVHSVFSPVHSGATKLLLSVRTCHILHVPLLVMYNEYDKESRLLWHMQKETFRLAQFRLASRVALRIT